MKIISIDYGRRHVGLAKTDESGRISLREGVLEQRQSDVLEEIRRLVERERAGLVLVGLPVRLAGGDSEQTRETRKFIAELQNKLGKEIGVKEVNEMFTSKEAARRLKFENGKAEEGHAEAARLILETYLRQNTKNQISNSK
jgi:putative holliday junction resolvase